MALVLAAGLVVGAVSAAGAPAWVDQGVLDSPGTAQTRVVSSAAGEATAAWIASDGNVKAATRPAGGAFGTAQTLSSGGQAEDLNLVIDPSGNVVAVWTQSSFMVGEVGAGATDGAVLAARKPAGGSFASAQRLSTDGRPADDPAAAAAENGVVGVAFEQESEDAMHTRIATRLLRPGQPSLDPIESVSGLCQTDADPSLAADGSGVFTVTYLAPGNVIEAAQQQVSAAGGVSAAVWGASFQVAAGESNAALVAADAAGNLTWTWFPNVAGNPPRTASRPAGGAVSPVSNVGANAGTLQALDLQVNSGTGDALIAFVQGTTAFGALGTAGGAMGAPATVSGAGQTVGGAISAEFGGSSNAYVAFPTDTGIFENVRDRGTGAWQGSPTQVSALADNVNTTAVELAFDGAGNGFAAWDGSGGATDAARAAAYDAVAPQVNLLVPATAQVGQAVPITTSATDVVGPTGAPQVAFGDGATGSGTTTSHSYGAAGTYTVTATVADAVGNTSTAAAQIVVSAVGTCAGLAPTIVGTAAADVIDALEGNDDVDGAGGGDTICLGPGIDTGFGSGGNDRIFGQEGADEINAGPGDDAAFGGGASDLLRGGGGGGYRLDGNLGDDILDGKSGADALRGGEGSDALVGRAGNDLLLGGGASDVAFGGPGADRLLGGAQNDRLEGNRGNDVMRGDAGDDTLLGGQDDDRLFGSPGADTLRGGSGVDAIAGGRGPDRVFAGADDDRVAGNAGRDRLRGQAGDDTLLGGLGGDSLFGGLGRDRTFGGADVDRVFGGPGRDLLSGGPARDLLVGGGGPDLIAGDGGADLLRGSSGDDLLRGEDDDDVLRGGAGADIARGGPGNDTCFSAIPFSC